MSTACIRNTPAASPLRLPTGTDFDTLPPSPNHEWLPRIDTHPSFASPGLFTNPQTSNTPSAEGPYSTALIQRPNPTQPRQIAPPQSPSSSAQSRNTIYAPRGSPMDRLYGTLFKTTLVSTLPNQASTPTLAGQYNTSHYSTTTLPDQYNILHASTTTLAGQYWTPHDSTTTLDASVVGIPSAHVFYGNVYGS